MYARLGQDVENEKATCDCVPESLDAAPPTDNSALFILSLVAVAEKPSCAAHWPCRTQQQDGRINNNMRAMPLLPVRRENACRIGCARRRNRGNYCYYCWIAAIAGDVTKPSVSKFL